MNYSLQSAPRHENPFLGDAFLRRCLARLAHNEAYDVMEKDLARFGDRVAKEIWELGQKCEEVRFKITQPFGICLRFGCFFVSFGLVPL